jgi:hypothetical protein
MGLIMHEYGCLDFDKILALTPQQTSFLLEIVKWLKNVRD